ncbi:MarR family winged helix-turn-helix transcriptional regulator [Pseudonocardia acaciae]|uniref:MarR family winged helix-turn-helix transcriptional regulator n=1 Tax=Pseudonocardia acaciae TaxID=551276 RepID=UPI0007E8E2F2|nr:MarR family transcriptional regulator [Pseudonocardia acaciae]
MPTPRTPAITYPSVVELLDHADRAVDAVLTPVTEEEGLSREGWRVLLLLSRGGGRSMGEIAEHAAVPNPTATRVVDRLVAQSFAFRRNDPADRRRVLVHLSPNGREVVARISRQLEQRVDGSLVELADGNTALSTLLARLAHQLPVPATE